MRYVSLVSVLLAVLGQAPAASANPMVFGGALSGVNVAVPNDSPGSGTFALTLDRTAQTAQINASFSDLTGTDTAAHIHCCSLDQGNAGGATVLPSWPGFPLGVTQGTYSSPVFSLRDPSFYTPNFIAAQGGLAAAEAALINGIENREAWFGIHTTAFPKGEIGTQLLPVGEPTSLALLAAALAGLGVTRRRN